MIIETSVCENEIAKFAELANKWWDPNGPCAPLHVLNPVRVKYVQKFTKVRGQQILDLGCGAGILTESLAKLGGKLVGVDPCQEVISAANDHAVEQNLNITYLNTSVEELISEYPTYRNNFDCIVCMELLEHVTAPQLLLQACAQLLKPNGKIFLSTLNRTPKAYATAVIAAEYILKLLPKNTHSYDKFIRPAELNEYLQANALQLQDLQGIKYNPFTKSAKFTSDVQINYLAYATLAEASHD